ncbi:MAG: hypothetical protein R3Y08_03585 [Rikenellaceae bacterium]
MNNNYFSFNRFCSYLWCEIRLNLRQWSLLAFAVVATATITNITATNIWHKDIVMETTNDMELTYPIFLLLATFVPTIVAGAVSLTVISKLFSGFHRDGGGSFAMMLPASTLEKFAAQFSLALLVQITLIVAIDILYIIFCYKESGQFCSTFTFVYSSNQYFNNIDMVTATLQTILFQASFFLAGIIFKKSAFIKCCAIHAALFFVTIIYSIFVDVKFFDIFNNTHNQIILVILTITIYVIGWLQFRKMQIKK